MVNCIARPVAAAIGSLALVVTLAVPAIAGPGGDQSTEPVTWPAIHDGQIDADQLALVAEAFGASPAEADGVEGTLTALNSASGVTAASIATSLAEEAVVETATGGNSYVSVTVGQTASGVPTITIVEQGSYFEGGDVVEVDGVLIDISEVFAPPATAAFASGSGASLLSSSISGCTALADSGGWKRRVGCRLYSNGGAASGTMIFDYSVKSGGGRIDGTPYAHDQQCVAASDRNVKVFVPRKINSGSVPAQARHQFDCYYAGGTYSHQAWHAAYAYGSVWGEHN